MLSFEGQRKLRELLFEVMVLEQKIEYIREELCMEQTFEPYSAFQRIAGDRNKQYIYIEDIQRFLLENRFNQPYENCVMYIKQYELQKNSFHLSYVEFLECVFPFMNTRLREEVAQRDKYEFQELLPYEVEKNLSELINYEANYLQKLDRLKGELRDSDQNFSPVNCFKAIDMETLGFIDEDAVGNFMVKNGSVLTEDQKYFIVRHINKNKSGQITLEEFTSFIIMQYPSQYNMSNLRTRAKSFNLTNSYSDQEYTNFYLQKYNYINNSQKKKINDLSSQSFYKSTNCTKNQLNSSNILSQDELNQPTLTYSVENYHDKSLGNSKIKLDQDQYELNDRICMTSAKKNKNNDLQDNYQFSQSAQKQYKINNISYGNSINQIQSQLNNNPILIEEKLKLSHAKNNIFEQIDSDPKKSIQQIMLGSTAQSFYVPHASKSHFRNSSYSQINSNPIFGKSTRGGFTNQKFQKENNFEGEKKEEFKQFLKNLLTISNLDKSIETTKLEFLGLINFSPCNLFDYIDEYKRQNIVFQELYDFITLQMNFKSFTKKDCYIIFQHFDIYSRGFISKDDFIQKFTPLDPLILSQKPYTPIELLTEAEKSKLKIYFQTIVNHHQKIYDIKQSYNQRNPLSYNCFSLNELFNLLDRDNDSYLSIYDIKLRFEEEMIDVSKEQINYIFYRFDKNNLTKISFQDFIKEFSTNRI